MTARNKNIPALRFKGFNSNWQRKPLVELSVNGFSNGAFNDPKKVGQGYRIINVKDMYIDGPINIETLTRVAIDEKEFAKNRVEYGDIFFTRSSLVKAGIAYSNVNLNKADDLTFDGHLIRMRPNKEHSPIFLYYNFSTSSSRKQFIKRGKTATMTTIGQEDIAKVEINFPSLPEQQKIASFLAAIDEKVRQLTRRKELLEQYKKGMMQQLFSGKLRFKPAPHEIAGDEKGKAYPKWEEKKIGDITKVIAGGTPNTFKKEYWGGDIRWMNSGELNLKIVHEVENRITEEGMKNSSTKLIPKKCILIGLAGQGKTRGTAAMNMVELCTNQSIASIFPNYEKFIPEYLYQNIDQRYSELRGMSTGDGGRGGLNLQIIKSFIIPLPSVKEQQKIASFLSSIDTKIESVAAQIERTQGYKKGLLQQMFV